VAILGTALVVLGMLGSLVFSILILIKAFQTSIGWGIGSLLLAPVLLVFVFTHWAETKKPFLYSVLCWVLVGLGTVVGVMAAGSGMPTH
jgi:hypothetical protein